jgi:hypothetical protein
MARVSSFELRKCEGKKSRNYPVAKNQNGVARKRDLAESIFKLQAPRFNDQVMGLLTYFACHEGLE